MKVVNFWAGPGAGKSTMATGLFYRLKMAYVNAELVTEYAKDATWEGRHNILRDQLYVTAKQHRRLSRLLNHSVEWAVTDSPLLLGAVYDSGNNQNFRGLLKDLFDSFDNVNYFLIRKETYVGIGRNQTREEAIGIDTRVRAVMDEYGVQSKTINVNDNTALDQILLDLVNNHGLVYR